MFITVNKTKSRKIHKASNTVHKKTKGTKGAENEQVQRELWIVLQRDTETRGLRPTGTDNKYKWRRIIHVSDPG